MSLINRLKKGITICEEKWHNYYLSNSVFFLHKRRTQSGERRKKKILTFQCATQKAVQWKANKRAVGYRDTFSHQENVCWNEYELNTTFTEQNNLTKKMLIFRFIINSITVWWHDQTAKSKIKLQNSSLLCWVFVSKDVEYTNRAI